MKKENDLKVIGIVGSVCFALLVLLIPKGQEAKAKTVEVIETPIVTVVSAEEIKKPSPQTQAPVIYATEEEIDLMARVVMSEASILPLEGKQAVAQTIVNRVRSDKFPNSIEGVIDQPYQYSTADNGIPDSECYQAVEAALMYEGFPTNMFYFRIGKYHNFGIPYIQIGNTFFSLED